MRHVAVFLIAVLSAGVQFVASPSVHAQSGPGPAKAVTLHFTNGLKFDVPAGWRFSELGPTSVMLHYGTGDTVFDKGNPNKFSLVAPTGGNRDVGKGYGRLDRQGKETVPGGTKVEWYAGPRFQGMHYSFSAQIENNYSYLSMTMLDRTTPAFSAAVIEAGVMSIARSVRKTNFHSMLYHPAGMRAALPNKAWYSQGTEGALRLGCFQTNCGGASNTWLYAYRSGKAFTSDAEALKDITGYFEQQEKLTIGAVHSMALESGTFLWTEQPATARPLLGIVRRAGQYYFVSAFELGQDKFGLDGLRPHFLQLATSLHPWDGR